MQLSSDPSRPLLTYYDDATGERTELSGTALDNWVSKTANLLAIDCGLGPGDRAAVLLPPHWQTAAVLLGAWTAGLSVDLDDPAAATPPATAADAVFVAASRSAEVPAAEHRFVLGLDPMGMPLRTVPDGFLDYITEVRGQPDQLIVDGTGHRPWDAAAREAAAASGIGPGDRVLVDVARHGHPVQWLLAPLVAGASVVLCANLDPGKVPDRVAAEQVTRTVRNPFPT